VALEVGIVGPSGSGKTSLFTALTKAGGGEYGKTNVGMAPIADERLQALARVVKARKITPATIRVQDVPGSGAAQLGNLRQVDALLVVLRGFGADATPEDDLETFRLELLVADRDHVERRLDRVAKQAKSGDSKVRAEGEELAKVLAHVDAGRSLAEYPGGLPGALEPLTS
jgi:ribosome-binding ATPase YchF (GTP1/OBG family)